MTISANKTTILIVDDLPENLSGMERILKELDVDIVTASSGNEALKATLYNDFSLILLDVLMPGMSGIEVAEALKEKEETADIPILFITAMGKDESYELDAYDKGAVDYIYKPVNEAVLLSKVRAILDIYSPIPVLSENRRTAVSAPPKILVVDDNRENILVLEKLLKKLDAEIVSTTSGNDALSKTLYNDFAVIFLDVQMPGMDGYEVAELLKSEEKTADIPIIFITAIDRDDAKELKGYDKGAVDFIFKPFNEFILLSKAKIFLEIYQMKKELQVLVDERTSALKKSNQQLTKEVLEKQKAEGELLQARAYLSSIVNSIDSVLIGADCNGKIVDLNKAAVQISGSTREEAIGESVYTVFSDFSEILKEMISETSGNEAVQRSNMIVKTKAGERFYNMVVSPLIGENTNQFVIRINDVTDAKQMEMELQQRRHIDSLGQLAGGIAHDFNNMLSAIMGAADLLRLKFGDNQGALRAIQSILTSSERAADLTAKLLSFSRKESNTSGFVDIHRLIKDTVIILQRSIDKRIKIVVESLASNSVVKGDDSELSSVFLNLGINARDAMPDGGELVIRTVDKVVSAADSVYFHGLAAGEYIEISFADTGVGMTSEVKQKIFEPFFTTKATGKGTGLGLSLVYGTVKTHRGVILVESEEGAGSVFKIFLPVNGEKSDSADSVKVADTEEKHLSGTVLLVDDEDIVRSIGAQILESFGLNVIVAENGRRAIDVVKERQHEINLILLDMIMPELNGPDCHKKIKEINPSIKVIICSGYAPQEMIDQLSDEGIVDFVQKPFRMDELRRAIAPWLSD